MIMKPLFLLNPTAGPLYSSGDLLTEPVHVLEKLRFDNGIQNSRDPGNELLAGFTHDDTPGPLKGQCLPVRSVGEHGI